MSDTEPRSPCVSVCVLDNSDVCTACYRSANEITDWLMATPAQKRDILRRARERREASGAVRFD